MEIREEKEEKKLTLFISGELDLEGGPELTSYLENELENLESLTLNMADITYLSSAGIRAILAIHRQVDGKIPFKITGCNTFVYEVFEITGLDEILDLEK